MKGRGGKARGRGRGRGASLGRSPPRRIQANETDGNRENQYCLFCKVQFSNVKSHNDHKESVVHKQKEILIAKALSDGLQFCYSCEKIFASKIELDAHALMARHQPLYRVEGLNELIKEEQDNQENKDVPEVDERREQDNKDRHTIVMKLNKLREDEEVENKIAADKLTVWCQVCNVNCLNKTNLKVHQDSWRHRAEVDKKKDDERKIFEEEAERRFQEADETERIKVPIHLADESKYFCEVCSVALSGEVSYVQHLKGKRHHRQVAQMKLPYKCYVCKQEFQNEKDFGSHLESRSHINKAFKRDDGKGKPRGSRNDEWVEKKDQRDGRKDRRSREKGRDRERDREKDRSRDRREPRKEERKSNSKESKSKDDRKVEIVQSPAGEGEMLDLREKLSKKIVITKPNDVKIEKDSSVASEPVDPNKRAKELEMEAKFKKLSREYYNDLNGLKERLTRERENDISVYQEYESTYNKLCQEEDFVRENLRVLEEDDPRKEEYIRDMIRIQRDMREVRQELEIREMMIIKRETLVREKFPNSNDTQVVLNTEKENDPNKPVVIDYNHGNNAAPANATSTDEPAQESPTTASGQEQKQSDADLRIQLERERLLKRLGPELAMVDPSLREKLLSVIMDKDAADKETAEKKQETSNQSSATSSKAAQMKKLTEREKQLEKELADLKSTAPSKKLTKSLVPQYDDLGEKAKEKKRHGRTKSISSNSSRSSSSSSDSDSRYRKKRRKSPKSRNKSKRSGSISSDRSRKKRRRSTSRDRDRKKKSNTYSKRTREDDRKKKSDRKKPVKIMLKSRQKGTKLTKSGNPLPGDSDSDVSIKETEPTKKSPDVAPISTIPVIGSAAPPSHTYGNPGMVLPSQTFHNQPNHNQMNPHQMHANQMHQNHNRHIVPPQPKREQFSFWKNSAAPVQKDSPKEDVWDIAFSGGQAVTEPVPDTFNLFNSPMDAQNTLSADILNILKSVAPMLQNRQALAAQPSVQSSVDNRRLPGEPLPRFSGDRSQDFITNASVNNFEKMSNENSLSGVTAGGRVRSILKKMKEPPKPIKIEEEPTPVTGIPGIPGLDSTSSFSETSTTSQSQQLENTFNSIRNRQPDVEEEKLYGNDNFTLKPDQVAAFTPRSYSEETRSPNVGHTEIPGFGGEKLDRPTDARRSDAGSPWTVEQEQRRRLQDDERGISSAVSYSRQPIGGVNTRNDDKTSEYQRDRSPVGNRKIDDPYRSRDTIDERDRIGEPNVPPPPDPRDFHLRPLPVDGRQPLQQESDQRIPAGERDPYLRAGERPRDNRLERDVLPPSAIDRHNDVPQRFADRRYVEVRSLAPPSIPVDNRPPVRKPGESEDVYYERFERYYEIKRMREQGDKLLRERGALTRLPPTGEELRRMHDSRALPPHADDYYQRQAPVIDDRYDVRYRRPEERRLPLPDEFARARGYPDRGRDERLVADGLRRHPDERYRRIEDDRRIMEEDHRRVELPHRDGRVAGYRDERDPFGPPRRVIDETFIPGKDASPVAKIPPGDLPKDLSKIDRGMPEDRLGVTQPAKPAPNPPPPADVHRASRIVPGQQPPPERRPPPGSYLQRYQY